MKNVWILNHYALAPTEAGGTRHFSLASALLSQGWRASIVAASVDFVSGRQRLNDGESTKLERIEGVEFLWIRTPSYAGNGAGRLLNMLAYTGRSLLKQNTVGLPKPDLIVGSSVHPFAALSAAFLARRYRFPFIFEVRDLWPRNLIDMGRIKEHSLAAILMRRLERWLYMRASRIIVLLPYAKEYIAPLGVDPAKIFWVPNGVDLARFPSLPAEPEEQRPFVLMYFGAFGQANGLEQLLDAMHSIKDQPVAQRIRLRMIGAGPLKPALEKRAAELGLSTISFEPPVPKQEIPALAAQADAFVILIRSLPKLYKYGVSMNKLFDYLAAQRPIVIASDAANNPVKDADAGIAVAAGDVEALGNAILQISQTPWEARNAMGRRGRAYVENHFDYAVLGKKMAVLMNEAVDASAEFP